MAETAHSFRRVTATKSDSGSTLAYRALFFFSLIYFIRPEDFIPGLNHIPIAKIAGGIALLALIFAVPAVRRYKLTIELKVLILLLAQMILCIPFAAWRGGAYDAVINKFSKGVIVAILIYMVTTSVMEIRKLLAIQAVTIAVITLLSVIVHRTEYGRLMGIQQGILENPNDLAINIAITFPLCVAFLLASKGLFSRLFWAIGLAFMAWGVVATYSRSGLLAMAVTIAICVWEFGIKGKRPLLVLGVGLAAVIAVAVFVATPHYLTRMESIVLGNIEGSGDRGSLEARQELLKESLTLMVQHPMFGIGPGNFASFSDTWHVAHNTYTEFGAEAGVPALGLFFIMICLTLRKIRSVCKLPGYQTSNDVRLWASGLWAAMAAYIAGAMFASTEYNLFPYFMVGYVCALYRIASVPDVPDTALPAAQNRNCFRSGNFRQGEPALVRTR